MSSNEAGSRSDHQAAASRTIEQRTDQDYQAEENQVQDEPFPASRDEDGKQDTAPESPAGAGGPAGPGGGSGGAVSDLDGAGGD